MDSENSKTSDPHRLLVNLSDKINLKRSDKYVALSNLSIYYTWQITKKVIQRQQISCDVNEEFELPDGSNFCIRYLRLFWIYLKKDVTVPDNPSIRIHVNKIDTRITFKIKAGSYIELLTTKIMKLFRSTKSKVTND